MRVHLRKLKNKNGTVSLRLDTFMGYYIDENGQRKAQRIRETLPLKLVEQKDKPLQERNRSILDQAEKIRAEKERLLLQSGSYPFFDKNESKSDFYIFLDQYIKAQIKRHPSSKVTWQGLEKHLKNFKSKISFEDLNATFYQDFLSFLEKKALKSTGQSLQQKSINLYYSKFKRVLQHAAVKQKLKHAPRFPKLKSIDSQRYIVLNEEDIIKLNSTHCANHDVKNAFLFALHTGLNYLMIKDLCWKNIIREMDAWLLDIPDRNGRPYLYPLNQNAIALLGSPAPNPKLLFPRIRSKSENNIMLLKWAQKAQVQHTLTFNVAKYTFVQRSISEGMNVELIQQLLGHMKLKTTQNLIEKLGVKNPLLSDPLTTESKASFGKILTDKPKLIPKHKRIQLRNYSYTFPKINRS